MSAFLMNSASFTEPKFPPAEEYAHANYMSPPQNTDYYRQNIHNYGYGTNDYRRYELEEKYTPNNVYNSQNSVSSSCTSTDGLLNKRVSVHNSAHQHPQISPPQAHVQNPNSTNTHNLSVSNNSATNININNRLNGFTSQGSPSSPEDSGSPQSVPSPGSQDSPESSSCNDQPASQPVIYPWMRKSQSGNNNGTNSGNSGKNVFFKNFTICLQMFFKSYSLFGEKLSFS